MRRLIAIVMLVCTAVALSAAQEAKPEVKPMKLSGSATVKISELAVHVAKANETTIDVEKVGQVELTHVLPSTAVAVEGDALFMLLQNALAQYRYVLVPHGDGWAAVTAAEAHKHAPVITRAEVATSADWKWVRVKIELENVDANAAAGALRNLVARQGGAVAPSGRSAIEICERTDRVRELLKVVDQLSGRQKSEITVYPVPAGLTDQDVMHAITAHFARRPGFYFRVEVSPNGSDIDVTGPAHVQAEIARFIEALKE